MLFNLLAYMTIPSGIFGFALLQVAANGSDSPSGWAGLGVGGTLAFVMFYFYRQDRLTEIAARAVSEARIIAQAAASESRLLAITSDFRQVITDSTAATATLTEQLNQRAGRMWLDQAARPATP